MVLDLYIPILEDLTLTTRTILSDIPSHTWVLGDVSVDRQIIFGIRCLFAERDYLKSKQLSAQATTPFNR